MAISIKNILIACKNLDGCGSAAMLTSKLAKAYHSKVLALISNTENPNLKSILGSESVQTEKVGSSAVKSIKEFATETSPDLVVLPVRTAGGEVGIVSHNEANSIIDYLERMVLTVPAGNKDFNFDKIVVPVDSSFETRQKVPYAESLAQQFGATLYVLGVSNDNGKDSEVTVNNYARQVCRNIEEKGLNYEMHTDLGGNPTDKTIAFAQKINAGLIVIMTEQESNLTSFFSGKYSEQMVKKSTIPVLSVHPRDLVVSEARL